MKKPIVKNKGGRPKGSTTRPQLRDFLNQEDIQGFTMDLFERAKKSDLLAKWVGDQIFGKAVQPLGNEEGKEFKILFDNAFKKDD